jgi:hypothetical protein
MKRLLLLTVTLTLVGLFALPVPAQQQRYAFTTEVTSPRIQPGNVLGIKAVLAAANTLPPLASRDCYFLMGLAYNPRRFATPLVVPALLIGRAEFQLVRVPVGVKAAAGMRLPIPRMRLPANFKLPLWVQGVAVMKDRNSRMHLMPAQPAMTVLVP